MSEVEHLDGRQIVRDPVSGRFTKVTLDPQTAREMGQVSSSIKSSAERLLQEQGYDKTNPAPEYIVVMASQAQKFPAAMAHWRRVHSLADQTSGQGGLERPQPGEACALCGKWNTGHLGSQAIADLLREVRELDVPAEDAGENPK